MINALVPFAHVTDISSSIQFYERLGFSVRNTFIPSGQELPSWVWLESAGASLMLARAAEPVVASQQAVLFYLYVEDVLVKHAELNAIGMSVGPVTYPFYSERGEFRLEDPDGYVLMITHG